MSDGKYNDIEWKRRMRNTPKGAAASAWEHLNGRSGAKYNYSKCYENVQVRMTREEFMAWAVPKYREWFAAHPSRKGPDNKPTIDRIDTLGHYELGNIQLISFAANLAKKATVNTNAPEGTRWCPRCKAYIPLAEFYDSVSQAYCKKCTNKISREKREQGGNELRSHDRSAKAKYFATAAGAVPRAWRGFGRMKDCKLEFTEAEFKAWAYPAFEEWFKTNELAPTVKRRPLGPWTMANLMLVDRSKFKYSMNADTPEGMKRCRLCQQFKSVDEFYRNSKDGKPFGYCKPCQCARVREAARKI